MVLFCLLVLALFSSCSNGSLVENALAADESTPPMQVAQQEQASQKLIEQLHVKFSEQIQAVAQRERVRVSIMELPVEAIRLGVSRDTQFDDKALQAVLDQPQFKNTLEELAGGAASVGWWPDFTLYDVEDIDADPQAKMSLLATTLNAVSQSPRSIVLVLPSNSPAWLSELGKLENLSSVYLCGEYISFQTIEELGKLKKIPSLTLMVENGSQKTLEALAGLGNVSALQVGGDFGGDAAMKSIGRMQNLTSLLIVNFRSDENSSIVEASKVVEAPSVDESSSPKRKPADPLWIEPEEYLELVETPTLPEPKPGDLTKAEVELTEEGLLQLSKLPHLKSLQLFERTITAKQLQAIAKIQGLASLRMIAGKIAEEGLQDLVGLKDLTKLELSYFYLWYQDQSLTDVGVAAIGRLNNLKALSISVSGVAQAGFTHLANLTNLSTFKLVILSATDEQLKWISLVRSISHLSLERGGVTDASLVDVGKLTNLKQLNLSATSVTDVGVA